MDQDPVTCPMCQGAIPGREIPSVKACPGCGADLSRLIRERIAAQLAAKAPPPPPPSFIPQAALFSLLAPCFSVLVGFLGRQAINESRVGMLLLGTFCSLFIVAGFISGVVAFFAPKGAGKGIVGKAIVGIFVNGVLISFAILGIFARQKVAASESNTAEPPRKAWSIISGK